MKTFCQPFVFAVSLAAMLALGGCGKSDDSGNAAPAVPSSSGHPNAPLEATPTPAPMTPATANKASVTLTSVELGSGVDAGGKVMAVSDSFAPSDSIYASVSTNGTGDATLDAKWSYQDGQIVRQDSKTLHANGAQATSFLISQPGGFPTGSYKVDISINGSQVASKGFSVK